jgi:hypothetical protein
MPAKKTTDSRMSDVMEAATALPSALEKAMADPSNKSLWADVEWYGAIIHRQARILAGKPRGG